MSEQIRLDKFLVFCRFARTRARAQAMVEQRLMRLNGQRVQRCHTAIGLGDVLTLLQGSDVRIITVVSLPDRRGPPGKARAHYRELDRGGESRIAETAQRE